MKRLTSRMNHAQAAARARIVSGIPNKPDYEEFESVWNRFWQEEKYFDYNNNEKEKPTFSMILPPPNITGNLHLGHALTVTIQDAIVRFKYMTGHQVSWVPGFDHAGIATHIMLNKVSLKKLGKASSDLTSDEYSSLADEWKKERMNEMKFQLESLGASFTHPFYYTLSDEMSTYVTESFIQLFKLGVIKREKSLVNWSFLLKSTLSDIEIEWRKFYKPTLVSVPGYDKPVEYGIIYTVSYPIEGSNEKISFATTRIETLSGDVAIAVNPNDLRYSKYFGRKAINPLTGQSIPIVFDETISPTFGTGAMKVTPSHSLPDFEICKKHNIPWIQESIFDKDGNIHCLILKSEYSHLNGMSRFAAKDEMVKILTQQNLFVSKERHETMVPFCSRSGDVVESITRHQWFIRMGPLVEELKKSLEANEITVEPSGGKSTWLRRWCASVSDWCISRQIKWGHRIPAFRPSDEFCDRICSPPESTWVVSHNEQDAKRLLRSKYPSLPQDFSIIQDEDVLDTWFSSALLPFTVINFVTSGKHSIGGEKNSFSLQGNVMYPLSLMETGHDILPFWVHKMAILSKVLTGSYGFKKVLMHGMVCDANGKKMTKSKGNVIDPVDVIRGATLKELLSRTDFYREIGVLTQSELESAKSGTKSLFPKGIPTCGTDSLRLSLIQQDMKPTLVKVSINDFTENRAFINKMWQSFRFVQLSCNQVEPFRLSTEQFLNNLHTLKGTKSLLELSMVDRWILSRMSHLVTSCYNSYKSDMCDLHNIHANIYAFWISELCDIYLEYVKNRVKEFLSSEESTSGNSSGKKVTSSELKVSMSLSILVHCMNTCLRVTHPIAPFVTEELYQRICHLLQSSKLEWPSEENEKMNVTSEREEKYMKQNGSDKCKLVSILKTGFPCGVIYTSWSNLEMDYCMHNVRQVLRAFRHLRISKSLSTNDQVDGSLTNLTKFIVELEEEENDGAQDAYSLMEEGSLKRCDSEECMEIKSPPNGIKKNSMLTLDMLSKMSIIIQDDFKYPIEIAFSNGSSKLVDCSYMQLVKNSTDDQCHEERKRNVRVKDSNPLPLPEVTFTIYGK